LVALTHAIGGYRVAPGDDPLRSVYLAGGGKRRILTVDVGEVHVTISPQDLDTCVERFDLASLIKDKPKRRNVCVPHLQNSNNEILKLKDLLAFLDFVIVSRDKCR
jgi:hypothetical protein